MTVKIRRELARRSPSQLLDPIYAAVVGATGIRPMLATLPFSPSLGGTAENTSRLTNALADRYLIMSHLGEGGMGVGAWLPLVAST